MQGQVVMITGCSSGFGRAAALEFARGGHRVAATVRSLDDAESLVAEASAVDGSLIPIELDVTDEQARSRAVSQVVEHFGRVDVLVNNAGLVQFGPLEATTDDVLRAVMEVGFFGPAALMRLVLPHMRAQGHGRIVNITSGAGHGVSGYLAAYGSAKHAVDALTATVDLEVAPFGVRVVSVVPGTYPTTGVGENILLAPAMEPYGDGHAQLVGALESAFGDRTDFSLVTDAIIAAATDPDPKFITMAGPELEERTGPVIQAKTDFHDRLRQQT